MSDIGFYCLLIGKCLMAVGLTMIFCIYAWVSFDLMTKQQEEFSRRHKKHLAREKQKASNRLIRDRASEMIRSIVAAIGPNQVVDLALLRKACKLELKRYEREANRLRQGERLAS